MTPHDHPETGAPHTRAQRHLPGHIAAALARAGSGTDSAGRPWEGRDLSGDGNPLHNFDDDDGLADAGYEKALADLVAGSGSEEAVHRALASARVFIPVVATLAEDQIGEHGFVEDKEADMALVTITAPDGRSALPAFTTVERLQAWHPEARPVAVYAARAALSAVSDGAQLLVVDPGAEVTFVLRRPGLWMLAQQRDWVPSYKDESHLPLISRLAGAEPAVAGVRVMPGQGVASRTADGRLVPGGGAGPELRLEVSIRPEATREQAAEAVGRIQAGLGADRAFAEGVDSLEISVVAGGPDRQPSA